MDFYTPSHYKLGAPLLQSSNHLNHLVAASLGESMTSHFIAVTNQNHSVLTNLDYLLNYTNSQTGLWPPNELNINMNKNCHDNQFPQTLAKPAWERCGLVLRSYFCTKNTNVKSDKWQSSPQKTCLRIGMLLQNIWRAIRIAQKCEQHLKYQQQ